jgi:predicted RNA binding protein YcfA (HicA-like mRNA interferase family)
MNFLQVKKRLQTDGWLIKKQKGSHVHLVHPSKPGKLTIPNHGKKDLKPGTLSAIWKHAGLT